jgi:hypothetical protein
MMDKSIYIFNNGQTTFHKIHICFPCKVGRGFTAKQCSPVAPLTGWRTQPEKLFSISAWPKNPPPGQIKAHCNGFSIGEPGQNLVQPSLNHGSLRFLKLGFATWQKNRIRWRTMQRYKWTRMKKLVKYWQTRPNWPQNRTLQRRISALIWVPHLPPTIGHLNESLEDGVDPILQYLAV